jgi:hypothetical protein
MEIQRMEPIIPQRYIFGFDPGSFVKSSQNLQISETRIKDAQPVLRVLAAVLVRQSLMSMIFGDVARRNVASKETSLTRPVIPGNEIVLHTMSVCSDASCHDLDIRIMRIARRYSSSTIKGKDDGQQLHG